VEHAHERLAEKRCFYWSIRLSLSRYNNHNRVVNSMENYGGIFREATRPEPSGCCTVPPTNQGDVKSAAVTAAVAQQTVETLEVINSIRRMGRSISDTLALEIRCETVVTWFRLKGSRRKHTRTLILIQCAPRVQSQSKRHVPLLNGEREAVCIHNRVGRRWLQQS
jgi:hypothetical protein